MVPGLFELQLFTFFFREKRPCLFPVIAVQPFPELGQGILMCSFCISILWFTRFLATPWSASIQRQKWCLEEFSPRFGDLMVAALD
jgi:hypothetical protein